MKYGHLFWGKHREADEVVGLQELFNNYWSSNDHEFTVLGQSLLPISPRISSDREGQRLLSLESIVSLWNYDSLQMIPFVPLLLRTLAS